jgi:hypothetical protein
LLAVMKEKLFSQCFRDNVVMIVLSINVAEVRHNQGQRDKMLN